MELDGPQDGVVSQVCCWGLGRTYSIFERTSYFKIQDNAVGNPQLFRLLLRLRFGVFCMFYRQYGGTRTLCVIAVVAVGLAFTASAVATIGNKVLGDTEHAPTKANSQESADSLVLLQRHAAADPSVTAASSQDISFEQRVRDEIEETAETWTPRRDIDRGGQDSGNRLQRKGRGRGSKRKRMERGRKASLKQRRKFNKKRKRLKLRTQILEMATPVHLSGNVAAFSRRRTENQM